MRKNLILLLLLLSFTYVKAQTILVNSNVVSVSQDVTFPFWLDSMSTVEIGTQVVSISALEFNIVPATNGNSLVFVQTKIITSQETVPNGKTWKLEGVLLDSTVVNNSSGGQIVVSGSGGNVAVALSQESTTTLSFTDAMLYCDSLVEGGYDNWVIPSLEEMIFVASGGGVVPGTRSVNKLWTNSVNSGGIMNSTLGIYFNKFSLTGGYGLSSIVGYQSFGNPAHVRCVRHESISVSGSGSSSGGSNTASTLGSGMPTMISNESTNTMNWGEAILYCDSLNEAGYSDWIMPSSNQLSYAISGGCIIPDSRTSEEIWTRTIAHTNTDVLTIMLNLPPYNGGVDQTNRQRTNYDSNPASKLKCRCVR
jgi:hypothetical protein